MFICENPHNQTALILLINSKYFCLYSHQSCGIVVLIVLSAVFQIFA